MKSLVVGLGIGGLYVEELTKLGAEVITVDADPGKNANFVSIESALAQHNKFDTAHICTPNFCHYVNAVQLADLTSIVFIEKPGVATAEQWQQLHTQYPKTKFVMVKNNQYRTEIKNFMYLAERSTEINIVWSNKNRIPKPGSWFTNKQLAFGGVSRDLLPHLLSYISIFFANFQKAKITSSSVEQRWNLSSIESSDYGVVDSSGTYNVDDYVKISLALDGKIFNLIANWRSEESDKNYISFSDKYSAVKHDLGLCPNYAYNVMIRHAVDHINDKKFWNYQLKQDLWIHKIMESVCK
jgi:predicted dehydrogenase